MKKSLITILIIGLMAGAALISCSNRGNPVKTLLEYPSGVVINAQNEHYIRLLDYQMFGQRSIFFQIYFF